MTREPAPDLIKRLKDESAESAARYAAEYALGDAFRRDLAATMLETKLISAVYDLISERGTLIRELRYAVREAAADVHCGHLKIAYGITDEIDFLVTPHGKPQVRMTYAEFVDYGAPGVNHDHRYWAKYIAEPGDVHEDADVRIECVDADRSWKRPTPTVLVTGEPA